MPGRGITPGGPGRTRGSRRGQARALGPQSGRSARGGEDPSAAALRSGEGARSPTGVWGLPPPTRPEPPGARRLRAEPRAPFLPGSRRGARGARPGSPPGPAERLSASLPSPGPSLARFCFLEARNGTSAPFILSHPVAPILFGEVRDANSSVGRLPGHPSRPPRRPRLPKLKEKRDTPSARLERGPEVPNFSPSLGR